MYRQLQISSQGPGSAQSSGLGPAAAAVHAGGLAAAAGGAWPGKRAYAGPPAVTSAVAASHAALGSAAQGSQRLGTAWHAAVAGPTYACNPTTLVTSSVLTTLSHVPHGACNKRPPHARRVRHDKQMGLTEQTGRTQCSCMHERSRCEASQHAEWRL